jgi:hypothetical protein
MLTSDGDLRSWLFFSSTGSGLTLQLPYPGLRRALPCYETFNPSHRRNVLVTAHQIIYKLRMTFKQYAQKMLRHLKKAAMPVTEMTTLFTWA